VTVEFDPIHPRQTHIQYQTVGNAQMIEIQKLLRRKNTPTANPTDLSKL
jgi:hypothetical protein